MNRSTRIAAAICLLALATGCGRVENASQAANQVAQATRQAGNAVANTAQQAGQAIDRTGQAMGNPTAATFREASDVAQHLVQSGYAAHAVAFVMGDVAYVAVETSPSDRAKHPTKSDIAAQVTSHFPSIRKVYVSEDPNVYARFQSFENLMRQGRPAQAVWQNFKTSVARMFPS
ncbi:YhcN/YlaJ family sporulation lipoprotein [Alicyclobacillus vulcanalis]|uniref:Sporulation lipoprotein, YhcN/YlaJ family n=1 Tax=Alicyclobacillus vulcanalis TaxID=252246 RepID=A0A1N7KL43_9BACL|nr:YhcN/YlaJ family sporulation lipoprotein [Alicyclobacillus vulcanalis]SIS62160.1 sporulation lipoprotein, YhcN/YlaJ family [Alicyclobacillus vulcanalis]